MNHDAPSTSFLICMELKLLYNYAIKIMRPKRKKGGKRGERRNDGNQREDSCWEFDFPGGFSSRYPRTRRFTKPARIVWIKSAMLEEAWGPARSGSTHRRFLAVALSRKLHPWSIRDHGTLDSSRFGGPNAWPNQRSVSKSLNSTDVLTFPCTRNSYRTVRQG